jgi:hypothetical protein
VTRQRVEGVDECRGSGEAGAAFARGWYGPSPGCWAARERLPSWAASASCSASRSRSSAAVNGRGPRDTGLQYLLACSPVRPGSDRWPPREPRGSALPRFDLPFRIEAQDPQQVTQLAEVARPVVPMQASQRPTRQLDIGVSGPTFDHLRPDPPVVRATGAKRDRQPGEAMVQGRTEPARGAVAARGLGRCRDDLHIDVARSVFPHAFETPVAQHAMQRIPKRTGHLPDLIQQQCTAVGGLESSDPLPWTRRGKRHARGPKARSRVPFEAATRSGFLPRGRFARGPE